MLVNFSVSHAESRVLSCSRLCPQHPEQAGCCNVNEPDLSCLTPPHLLVPGPGGAQTSVHPQKAITSRGASITVNCSTSCDQHTMLGLETQLAKREVDHGNNWKVFELSDVQKDSFPICYSSCLGNQSSALMNLTVYCEWLGPGAGLGSLGWGGGRGSPQQVGTAFVTWGWGRVGSH